jgi:ribonuclease E
LLPEEEEVLAPTITPVVEAKPVIETPRGRNGRTPRNPREPRNDLKTLDLPTAPVENAPAERPTSIEPTEAPPEAELYPTADSFAPAEPGDTEDHSTTAASLMSRGLRRGRLRFSGKTGRPERIETTPLAPTVEAQDVDAPVLEPLEDINALPAAAVMEAPEVPAVTVADLEAVAQQVEEQVAEITATTAGPVDLGTAPELEAVAAAQDEAVADVEAPKKTTRRRRRKSANVEKEVGESNPIDEAQAAQNEADADAIGLSFPGQGFEIAPEAPETVTEAPVAEAAPEAATEAAEVPEEAEAPKKPTRRRRSPRKKAGDDAGETTEG